MNVRRENVVERMLAHWRKLAGASHIGISCHVDPGPAKLFSPLVQTSSPELAYFTLQLLPWSNAELHNDFMVFIYGLDKWESIQLLLEML